MYISFNFALGGDFDNGLIGPMFVIEPNALAQTHWDGYMVDSLQIKNRQNEIALELDMAGKVPSTNTYVIAFYVKIRGFSNYLFIYWLQIFLFLTSKRIKTENFKGLAQGATQQVQVLADGVELFSETISANNQWIRLRKWYVPDAV